MHFICVLKVFCLILGGVEMDDENDTIIGFSDNIASLKPEVKQKNGKKSGGFQAMGLSFPVLKGVLKRGYKVPTPIQRKVCLIKNFFFMFFKCASFYFRPFPLHWKIETL